MKPMGKWLFEVALNVFTCTGPTRSHVREKLVGGRGRSASSRMTTSGCFLSSALHAISALSSPRLTPRKRALDAAFAQGAMSVTDGK